MANPVNNVDQLSHLTAEIEIDPALAGGGFSTDPIIIPDANLRSKIAAYLRRDENAPIFEADMLRMGTQLFGWGRGLEIKDLTGLEFARNLEYAGSSSVNSISDVSLLKHLVKLENGWRLAGNNISDVSPLKALGKTWKSLELVEHQLSQTFHFSKHLVKLENAGAWHWNRTISDVSPLKALGKTGKRLAAWSINNISDVSPLKGISKLGSAVDLDG